MSSSFLSQSARQRVTEIKVLLAGWSKVVRVFYEELNRDGIWRSHDRDLLDRGDGITVLLQNLEKRTVLLVKQARVVATLRGSITGETLEACNGLVDPGESPFDCAIRESEEELGHRLTELTPLGSIISSPGGSLERVHLFLGQYSDSTLAGPGGGLHHEGEELEILEVPISTMQNLIRDGGIDCGRTIAAVHLAQAKGLLAE